jgi:hypothetical protein
METETIHLQKKTSWMVVLNLVLFPSYLGNDPIWRLIFHDIQGAPHLKISSEAGHEATCSRRDLLELKVMKSDEIRWNQMKSDEIRWNPIEFKSQVFQNPKECSCEVCRVVQWNEHCAGHRTICRWRRRGAGISPANEEINHNI